MKLLYANSSKQLLSLAPINLEEVFSAYKNRQAKQSTKSAPL